jgi:hypothetical protein
MASSTETIYHSTHIFNPPTRPQQSRIRRGRALLPSLASGDIVSETDLTRHFRRALKSPPDTTSTILGTKLHNNFTRLSRISCHYSCQAIPEPHDATNC